MLWEDADVTDTSMNTQWSATLEGSELPHSCGACWGASESMVATLMLSRYSSTLTWEHVQEDEQKVANSPRPPSVC